MNWAANMPETRPLPGGDFQVSIGATTSMSYRKSIEKDTPFGAAFQAVGR